MKVERFKYCSHDEEKCHQEGRPLIRLSDLEDAWTHIHSRTDLAWDSLIEQFEAHQPGLRDFLFNVSWPFSREAHREWQLQTLTVWTAFSKRFPGARPVAKQELFSLMAELQPEFTQPELCLCRHHQLPAIRGVLARLEYGMDQVDLTVIEGNQLIKNMVLIFEALDRFATAPEPQHRKMSAAGLVADSYVRPGKLDEEGENPAK
jgi:hypothetical protein